jgi:hypothetical protein
MIMNEKRFRSCLKVLSQDTEEYTESLSKANS